MSKAKGKSLCIFSSKGGTGKSVTTLNLAGVFASLGKKVLIVDFDLSNGSIATYLNKVPSKTIFNVIDDYINNRFKSIEDYVTPYSENISFLASVKDPRQGAKISSSYIEIVLEKSVFAYDIVLVDTNHVLSEFNVTLLDKCDNTLLILTNDLLDIKNMRNIIQIFNDADKTNYKIMLNNSISLYKKYYTLYDIKSIIKSNIDYVIDSNFFIKTMDNYVSDGIILTMEKKMPKAYPKVYKAYMQVYKDLLEDTDE